MGRLKRLLENRKQMNRIWPITESAKRGKTQNQCQARENGKLLLGAGKRRKLKVYPGLVGRKPKNLFCPDW